MQIRLKREKSRTISVYMIMVYILVCGIWCNYLHQCLLITLGGTVVISLELICCAGLVLIRQKARGDSAKASRLIRALYATLSFFVLYFVIYALGASSLAKQVILGISFPKQLVQAISNILYLIPLLMVLYRTGSRERADIGRFLLFIFITLAIFNIIAVIQNPSLSKTESSSEKGSLMTLGYAFSYCLAVLLPTFLYGFRFSTKRKKLFYAVMIASTAFSLYLSAYFIAILTAIIATLIYLILLIRSKGLRMALLLMAIGIPLYSIYSGELQVILRAIAKNIEIDQLKNRLFEIANFMDSGMQSATIEKTTFRFYMYNFTLRQFLSHPVLGNFIYGNYQCFYDHTVILDLLAIGGLMLGVSFFWMLRCGYQFGCSYLKYDRTRKVILTSYFSFIVLAFINPVLSYLHLGVLFFAIPILLEGIENRCIS